MAACSVAGVFCGPPNLVRSYGYFELPDSLSVICRFLANLPIRLARQIVGLSGLLLLGRANVTLPLRPALIDALQAPFGRFPGCADRLVAHDHEDRVGV